jgi:rare lipoprotein A
MRIALLVAFVLSVSAGAVNAFEAEGLASWYGGKFQGRRTASGEIFDTNELTAAHRSLPFESIVRVTNTLNDRSVVVRINDRGPFVDNRIIDLSRAAADAIGLTAVAPVVLEVLHKQQETTLRTIQVGAYSERGNALAAVERLSSGGLSPVIESDADDPRRPIHRVILQGIEESEIPDLRGRLADLGYGDILVRKK